MRAYIPFFVMCFFSFASVQDSFAKPPALRKPADVDIQELTEELQHISRKPDSMVLVWWIPPEFWAVALAQDPNASPNQARAVMDIVRSYTLLAVADGDMGPFGGVTYRSPEDTGRTLRVIDSQNTSFHPIPDTEISADLRNLTSMMRPVFIGLLGPLGENLHFHFFPGRNPEGKVIADSTREGSFSVRLADETFHWRLPLGSLLLPKTCPTDGEQLNGAWSYCPWHGKKLVQQ